MDVTTTRSRLCGRCRKLDFGRLFVVPCTEEELHAQIERDRSDHDFSYSWHLLKRFFSHKLSMSQDCALCKLVLYSIYSKARRAPTKLLLHGVRSRYRIEKSLWAPYQYSSTATEPEGVVHQWPLCLEVRMNGPLESAVSYNTNLLMCIQASSLPKSPDLGMKECILAGEVADEQFALGRLRPPLCDPGLFRMWLYKCETEHDLCRRNAPQPLAHNLRLIDVNMERVVEALEENMTEFPRYVALSYEWSDLQRVCLRTDNLLSLKQSGLSAVHDLHPCIQDAITTVRNMNEKYLWVDALCIVQNDAEDVAAQILQMGQIYQFALMTIVAAPNVGAPLCLPGASSSSAREPQSVIRLEDMALVSSTTPELGSTLGPVTRDSSWYTRAWTMQESILSHRRLIFTQYQVYFICQTCDWCEDKHVESKKYKLERDHVLKHQNELALSGLSLLSASDFVFEVVFQEFVMMYSARRLGDERDRLKAMNGVLSVITRDSPARRTFFWGIPVDSFEAHLCWSGELDWLHGVVGVMQSLPSADTEMTYFPSFSWLAWCPGVGHNGVRCLKLPYVSNIEPTIQCYMLDDAPGTRLAPTRISSRKPTDAPWVTKSLELTEDDVSNILPPNVNAYVERVCIFWTSVLQVEPFVDTAAAPNKLHLFAKNATEETSKQIAISMRDWDLNLHNMLHDEYELIMLGWELEGIDRENDSRIGMYVLLAHKFPNIGISQRVGLGTLSDADQWMAAQPLWKLVVLG